MNALNNINLILVFALLLGFKGYAQNAYGTNHQLTNVSQNKININKQEVGNNTAAEKEEHNYKMNLKPVMTKNSGCSGCPDSTKNKPVVPSVQMKENLFEGSPYKEAPLKE